MLRYTVKSVNEVPYESVRKIAHERVHPVGGCRGVFPHPHRCKRRRHLCHLGTCSSDLCSPACNHARDLSDRHYKDVPTYLAALRRLKGTECIERCPECLVTNILAVKTYGREDFKRELFNKVDVRAKNAETRNMRAPMQHGFAISVIITIASPICIAVLTSYPASWSSSQRSRPSPNSCVNSRTPHVSYFAFMSLH